MDLIRLGNGGRIVGFILRVSGEIGSSSDAASKLGLWD